MPKLTRKTQKIFCGNADNDQLAVFGSMATGSPVYTDDIEQLQNSTAYGEGWEAATLEDKAPFMEEMNGLQYGLSKQVAYTFQEGIPEYDANTTYYIGSIVKTLNEGKPILYASIIDENLNNPLTDLTSWEELKFGGGGGLPVGTIIPVTASSSYVPEGTLYCDGAEKTQSAFPDLWTNYLISGKLPTCTYSQFQTEVANTGACYKWAIDTTNKKFKVPFVPDKILEDVANVLPVNMAGFDTSNLKMTVSHNGYGGNMNFVVTETGVSSNTSLSFEVNTTNAKTYQTIKHFVVVATGSINQSQMDWSAWASGLNGKANTDLSNTNPNASFRRNSVRWGIPDYGQMVEIEIVSNGTTTYAAVKDGIVWGKQLVGTANKYITINGTQLSERKTSSGTTYNNFFFPVYQGDIVMVENATTSTTNNNMFFAPFRE